LECSLYISEASMNLTLDFLTSSLLNVMMFTEIDEKFKILDGSAIIDSKKALLTHNFFSLISLVLLLERKPVGITNTIFPPFFNLLKHSEIIKALAFLLEK
jgi:hypothetical protein